MVGRGIKELTSMDPGYFLIRRYRSLVSAYPPANVGYEARMLSLLGQCKWSEKRQLSPRDVREFAGTATSVASVHIRLLVSCTG